MTDFRFVSSQLNSKLLKADIGEAFQRFVHELLLYEYPTLHLFEAGGKDGGIDLSVKQENSRVFIECKHIAADSINTALSRWREVAKHLQCHISDRSQPTVGQRQYWPWYDIDIPVVEYIFCISSVLANQDQIDRLQGEISGFFKGISRTHSHLVHLETISVKILDWNDLNAKMMQYPQVLLRWFPRSRPIGLIPIDDFSEIGSFRSYLYSDMLTYYARHTHLQVFPAPTGSAIPDEEELFLELTQTELAGLIITGKGGVGKTRLTLEIGRLARRKGWLVLRCRGNLSADTIIQLTEVINKNDQVLIVADYVEVQREFNEFVETLLALNDTYDLHIRYVANCRISYYHSLASLPFHKQYNLSPSSQGPELKWIQGFQKAVVRHILECSLLQVAHEHLDVCRNKPVFAVFLSYLFRSGRGEELAELLGEKDFSRWVAKRLQLSFGEIASTRKLAQLMVLFPLPNDSLHHPDLQDSLPILERLASDGWMEKPSGEKSNQKAWEVSHDVLADQIILSYLESTQATSQYFLQDALSNAAKVGSFRSALVTMQRITDQPPLAGINWCEILSRHINEKHNIPLPDDHAALVRTSLLNPIERVKLLGVNEKFWEGAEKDIVFQNAIGWLARWAKGAGNPLADEADRAILSSWVHRAALQATESNYILSSGLKYCPGEVRDVSLEWISTRPYELQTHYLMVAWLENGLPIADIELAVWLWTVRFTYTRQLSFVVSSWLEAGGDLKLICDSILDWLEEFGCHPEAHFIYRAWLDAGGKLEMIQDNLKGWLALNAAGPGASSVYRSWLVRGELLDVVAPHIEKWLSVHYKKVEAGVLYRNWLSKGGDKQKVADYMCRWLEIWESELWAEPVYSAWLRSGGELELISDHIKAWLTVNKEEVKAGFIYHSWLGCSGDSSWIKPLLLIWLKTHASEFVAGKVYTAWLTTYGEPHSIEDQMQTWLEKNSTSVLADFLFKAWLKAGAAFSIIKPYVVVWLEANWESKESIYFVKFIVNQSTPELDEFETIIEFFQHKPESDYSARCLMEIIADSMRFECHPKVVKALLNFCKAKPDSHVTFNCLLKLLADPAHQSSAEDICIASLVVLDNQISPQNPLSKGRLVQIIQILGMTMSSLHFCSGVRSLQINDLFLRLLRNFYSLKWYLNPSHHALMVEFVHCLRELIMTETMTIKLDLAPLKSFLRWINTCSPEIKALMKEDLDFMSANFPAHGLWEIVKFESDNSKLGLEEYEGSALKVE